MVEQLSKKVRGIYGQRLKEETLLGIVAGQVALYGYFFYSFEGVLLRPLK